ncbi:CRAL-TRIO domain-containing protein [Radiomyces spectabilis]|uniref:CRAL-TRIO domain-containing protein n=1 Tax=Radiomyces spectabilis TaxID=64574 RepID=UPI0022210854|nr:CRAL-TRIO domain-containing protein [Radiomyces spectabilis]KAI8388459.1 CRAL-TRIO domain-containing protein [Radiomyces spectabilis]
MFKSKPAATESTTSEKDQGHWVSDPILNPPADFVAPQSPALDASQQEKLDQLRNYVQTIMLPSDHEYYPSEKGFLTDATLKRYMRARKWDFEAAKKMLENTIQWRREYRPEELDPEYIRPEATTGKMYFNGFSKAGRPLWVMRPRHQNSKDGERQVKHIVFCLERGIRLMPQGVETLDILIDFKDSSSSQNPSLGTAKKFLDILSNHYPERLGTAFLIKSPWFFFTMFKMISPLIDPVTKSKISFVHDENTVKDDKASSDKVFLQDYIDIDTLESEFGGRYPFKFDIDTYWTQLLQKTGNPYKVIDYM